MSYHNSDSYSEERKVNIGQSVDDQDIFISIKVNGQQSAVMTDNEGPNESITHIPMTIQFPSFAPSLQSSPKNKQSGNSSTFGSINSPEVHKISIHLPEELFKNVNDNVNDTLHGSIRDNHSNQGSNKKHRDAPTNINNRDLGSIGRSAKLLLNDSKMFKTKTKPIKTTVSEIENMPWSPAKGTSYCYNQGVQSTQGAPTRNVIKNSSGQKTLEIGSKYSDNVLVYCRMREPIKSTDCLKYNSKMVDDGENCYNFDYIFDKGSTQAQLYRRIASRHLEDFFLGKNSTIFTYGQTGSGKTHTMFGDMDNPELYGLIPRVLEEIFRRGETETSITCSMLEIYNEKLLDLFNPPNSNLCAEEIRLKEQNQHVYLENLQEIRVENKEELIGLIKFGHRGRKTATTTSNDMSSRSHTILFIYRNFVCRGQQFKCKMCFIDLAGSEKIKKSGAKGQTLEQTKKINLSLSCLGNVIYALTNGAEHIPYRNSKLTRILKDSLASDTTTSIITTCSLSKKDLQQSLSTIKFAVRAKKIKNRRKFENTVHVSLEQKFNLLKKELEDTKKELVYYKCRDQEIKNFLGSSCGQGSPDHSDSAEPARTRTQKSSINPNFETNSNQIPSEEAEMQPLRSLSYISKGVSSRIQLEGTGEFTVPNSGTKF